MFHNLLARVLNDSTDAPPLDAEDAEIAIAALMVRVARADDRYTGVEKAQIDRLLGRRGGVSSTEAADRRMAAEMIEAEAPDTVRLTRTIKQRIPLEERVSVMTTLWEVVYADTLRAPDEEAVVRLVSGLIGVSDRESNLARLQVLAGLDGAR